MDRTFKVMKYGQVLASLDFMYEYDNRGKVNVLVNRILDYGEDSYSTYALYEREEYFYHDRKPNSIEELKKYDIDFLQTLPDKDEFKGDITYIYENMTYRYTVHTRNIIAIADVEISVEENTKQLKYISAVNMRDDIQIPTEFMEINSTFIKRICETYMRNVFVSELNRVGFQY